MGQIIDSDYWLEYSLRLKSQQGGDPLEGLLGFGTLRLYTDVDAGLSPTTAYDDFLEANFVGYAPHIISPEEWGTPYKGDDPDPHWYMRLLPILFTSTWDEDQDIAGIYIQSPADATQWLCAGAFDAPVTIGPTHPSFYVVLIYSDVSEFSVV